PHFQEIRTAKKALEHTKHFTVSLLSPYTSFTVITVIFLLISYQLSAFFNDKITKLQMTLPTASLSPHLIPPTLPPGLSDFRLASSEEIKSAILASSDATCPLDFIPTVVLQSCLETLLQPITTLINLCLTESTFPSCFKTALVKPLVKKYSLPKDDLSSYRPISNLN